MGPKHNYNTCSQQDHVPARKAMTIDAVIEDIGFGWPQIKIGLMTSIVWLSDGMEIMVVTILGPTLEYEWHISPAQQALLITLVFVGFIVGSPIFGYISDKYGRWTAFWSIGALVNVAVAMLVIQYSWRYWLLLSAVPGLLFLSCSPFIPESPRYLLACGRQEEALKILKSLAAGNGHTLPDVDIIQGDIKPRGQFSDLFTPQNRKISILVGMAFFCHVFSYYGIALFSTDLIQAGTTCGNVLGVDGEGLQCGLQRHLLTTSEFIKLLWTTSAEFPGLLITVLVVDTLGRRWTAIGECAIVGFSLLALFICTTGTPMVMLLFVARGFALALFDLMFLYSSEVFPTEIRAIGTGFGTGMARLGGIITPFFAQVLFSYSVKLGLTAYVFVAFLTALVYFLLPETKGSNMGERLE